MGRVRHQTGLRKLASALTAEVMLAASNRNRPRGTGVRRQRLVPAVETAKQEGVCVWLVHGPPGSRADRTSTDARELWDAADERIELTQAFMEACSR